MEVEDRHDGVGIAHLCGAVRNVARDQMPFRPLRFRVGDGAGDPPLPFFSNTVKVWFVADLVIHLSKSFSSVTSLRTKRSCTSTSPGSFSVSTSSLFTLPMPCMLLEAF